MSAKSHEQDFTAAYDIKTRSTIKDRWHERLIDFILFGVTALLVKKCYDILEPVIHETFYVAMSCGFIGLVWYLSRAVSFCIARRRTSSTDTP